MVLIDPLDPTICHQCGASLDLEQQLARANGEKGYCHECTCQECQHDMSTHDDGDCRTCPECGIEKAEQAEDEDVMRPSKEVDL